MKWHRRFIEMAEMVAGWSKDPSTKVGCVLVDPTTRAVIATGYNGFPRGVDDLAYRMETRPDKYEWTEHAERNAVFNAARRGVSTEGAIAYLNWFPSPCCDCTRALIQAGVSKIVGPYRPFAGKGHWDFTTSEIMLDEAGVAREVVPD